MSTFSNGIQTDVIFVDTLYSSANIGPDCWNRIRPQPVNISVYLHLQNSYLSTVGLSDDVLDSINYGHLSKAINSLLEKNIGSSFGDVNALGSAVTEQAFELAGSAAAEVRVVIELPKFILLVGGFSVEMMTPGDKTGCSLKVRVTDLVLPVIIGVNPPEREAKQRVVTNITFTEHAVPHQSPNYSELVSRISKKIESSSYLTLEKFALEIIRAACLFSEEFEAVTVRAQKPSALSFARSSGVEITRSRVALLHAQA